MALFQPTNITPSSFSGLAAGTVDVTQDLTVSWQVNGNSPMTAYEIVIMQNDTASTVVLDTSKVALSTPFYGVNYKGETQYFSAVITAAQMASASMQNGYENGYKMVITQWWSETESIQQTSASYFITRAAPTLTMASIPSTIPYKTYTFSANYSQAQGDTVEWMQWQIMLADGSKEIILDTGKIYGTSEIKMEYDGFFTGNSYKVQCAIQTENGIEANTGWIAFSVEYNSSVMDGTATACALCNTDAIEITLPSNVYISGVATGTYSYETDALGKKLIVLGTSADSVTWSEANTEPLSIAPPYTIIISGVVGSVANTNTLFLIQSENYSLSMVCDSDGFYLTKDGQSLFTYPVQLIGGEIFKMVLSPQEIDMQLYTYTGLPTYPGTTVYPSETLYPSEGQQSASSITEYIDAWQDGAISAITVYGPNKFDFIWIYSGLLSPEQIAEIIGNAAYQPTYTSGTEFLANFDNTLSAGSLASDEEIEGFSVYRKANGEAVFYHLVDLPIGSKQFYDYGAVSQNTYQYYVYAATASQYVASSLATEPVTPVFWNYTVLCCSKDTNGIYNVENEYRFALDVSSGSVGNNNTPTIQQNFTRYPIRQPVNSNYRSGTLTAFIGKVQDDKYVDSIDLMRELYAMSTSSQIKFLKTRKGDLIRIETSAPISMQIGDKYVAQPAKISLPWVEVGDSDNMSIVIKKKIIEVPRFLINPITMELTMNYPSGYEEDAFYLDGADLYISDPGEFDESDYFIDDLMYLILNAVGYDENGVSI